MAEEHELTLRLSDPGVDLLERAGLAGLHMALRAAGESGTDLSPLTWGQDDLKSDSVTIRWTGPAKPGFVRLIEWAWQVRDGVLYLPAVHDTTDAARLQNRVAMHSGIFRTFLQHTNVQPKGEPVIRIITLDEDREVSVSYQPPIIRARKTKGEGKASKERGSKKLLKPWKDIDLLFDRTGAFQPENIQLSNWVYPGIAGRYEHEGSWEGPSRVAFLLMLAPTVCLYLRLQGEGGNWVCVLPDIRDLRDFADTRSRLKLNEDFIDVASLGDAGLRFLAEYSSRQPRGSLAVGCRVIAMGRTSYYGKKPGQRLGTQSIRKSVLDVPPEILPVKRYRILHRELRNTYIALKSEPAAETPAPMPKGRRRQPGKKAAPADNVPRAAGFLKPPSARGRIADNLVAGRPWYADLAVPSTWDREDLERLRKRNKELNDRDGGDRPTSLETILFAALGYQRSKLMNLIAEKEMWDDPHDRAFLEAFWETLSRLYFLERKAAEERGGSRTPEDRMNDLNEKTRRELMQAKTRLLLRKTLTEFFAKPAKLPRSEALCTNVAAVWRTIDANWRKGRDLALLALMTYQSREKREQQADNESTHTNEGA